MKPTATAAENPPPSVSKRWCRGFQDPVPVFTTKGKTDHVVKEPLIFSLLRRSNASFRAPACHNAPDCSGHSGAMVPPESSVRGSGAGSRMTLKCAGILLSFSSLGLSWPGSASMPCSLLLRRDLLKTGLRDLSRSSRAPCWCCRVRGNAAGALLELGLWGSPSSCAPAVTGLKTLALDIKVGEKPHSLRARSPSDFVMGVHLRTCTMPCFPTLLQQLLKDEARQKWWWVFGPMSLETHQAI